MPENSRNGWEQPDSEHLLYSYQRAIDEVLNLGAIPYRLFRILYPVWQVQIEGRQRIARNYEEVEYFIERGIHEVGLRTVAELSAFYGLETDYIQKLVDFLHAIGHIQERQGSLHLTKLGMDSVAEETFFEEHETSAILYFDGLGSRLLSRAHYNIPMYPNPPDDQYFYCLDLFAATWDNTELEFILSLPEPDRKQYDLPDTITQIEQIGQEPVYMPIYIVHCRSNNDVDLPTYLVFSRIRGRRDEIIEKVINGDNRIMKIPLHEPGQEDMTTAVRRRMESFGLTKPQWDLNGDSPHGMQVIVSPSALVQPSDDDASSEGTQLTVGNVGEYLLAYEWCVWLTCADPEIRHQAVIEQILRWLQFARATPNAAEYLKQINSLCQRLETTLVSQEALMEQAKTRGYGRALNRLDTLDNV